MDLAPLSPLLPALKPTEQIVLINLFGRAVDGEVSASQTLIADWTGIRSVNTIKAAIRKLSDRGFLQILKPGREEKSPAIFRLSLPTKAAAPLPPLSTQPIDLTTDNRIRLAAVKKSLSPSDWHRIKNEARVSRQTEEQVILRKYFGPERLRNG